MGITSGLAPVRAPGNCRCGPFRGRGGYIGSFGACHEPICRATGLIGLLQRVASAQVLVGAEVVGSSGAGILAFIGVERGDGQKEADRLLQRILNYRIFSDPQGRMDCSLVDTDGDLLLVPQFTLVADTRKGNRPGFSPAAAPEQSERWFDYLARRAVELHKKVETGRFGTDMQVSLVNDGPVTFWLQVAPASR